MILIENLRYICIFCTKGNKSLFHNQDLKEKMQDIIKNYFDQMEKKEYDVKLISINTKHVKIIFESKSLIDLTKYGEKSKKEKTKDSTKLTKFISNLKSVSSRRFLPHLHSVRSDISGIWTKNYLLATQEEQLDQKIESFLQVQEYKSIL